ncbi:type II CRISPR-associated endonuclease Cas1 [Ornithobacterium rhinotracheale]
MLKRTLFFGNPAYLSTRNEQLVVRFPEKEKPERTLPIEDLGVIVLEHPQITITCGLLSKLSLNKVLVVQCDAQHMPASVFQPLSGHTLFSERLKNQLDMSLPLKKNLWQQTVQAKITNQAMHLEKNNIDARKLRRWIQEVKSGDGENHEAYAAAYYFQNIFPIEDFSRNQKGIPPNHWLNYGYAVLRAVTARAITASGLLPALGIFHKNKYNAFCLADDLMEPYRPFVDQLINQMLANFELTEELTTTHKAELLKIPSLDVVIDSKKSPLMVAMSHTTNSFYECIEGTRRKIAYPEFC